MARMYGTYLRPRCPSCRRESGPDCADSSRGKSALRRREKQQWLRDVEDDIRDIEAELRMAEMVEKMWLPRWYAEDLDLIWVTL